MFSAKSLCFLAILGRSSCSLVDNRLVTDDEMYAADMAHYESLFADIKFPEVQEFRNRGRPYTVNVEGIVGTGKSTFLQFMKPYPNVDILPEPVDKWTNLNGTDLLQLIFDNPQRWALAQESYVQLTMLEEHLRRVGVAKVMERSIHSGRFIFVENLARTGQMQKVEFDIIARWYDFLNDKLPGVDLQTDLTVYLRSDPAVVIDRIRKRGRKEEAHISMDFLEGIHRLHEDWLVHRNTTFRMPSQKILVIDSGKPLKTMKGIYKRLAQKIWSIIPDDLKRQQTCYY